MIRQRSASGFIAAAAYSFGEAVTSSGHALPARKAAQDAPRRLQPDFGDLARGAEGEGERVARRSGGLGRRLASGGRLPRGRSLASRGGSSASGRLLRRGRVGGGRALLTPLPR